tara:strand:+ start:6829 stop:7788 length:960 start_codon:yes stop_codon:yes gene_type:complete
MGFLDNSGDIILDAVLTDHGRKVLSKGNGSFKIVKFALGDEEVNYELYDNTNTNGSAYYDLEILQTPVLEAFTDNAISMRSKLVTYENLDLLYLPMVKLNERAPRSSKHSLGAFIVAVDGLTENDNGSDSTQIGIGFSGGSEVTGILFGQTLNGGGHIHLDQGIDSTAISYAQSLPPDMIETAYTIQIDSRMGSITDVQGSNMPLDYIDDDGIAYYTVTKRQVSALKPNNNKTDTANDDGSTSQVIKGPRGTTLKFKIRASLDLNTSTFLFTEIGSESSLANRAGATSTVYHIDTTVRVTGISTGYTVDIPVRFVKYKS